MIRTFSRMAGAVLEICTPDPGEDERQARSPAIKATFFLGGGLSKGNPAIESKL